MKTPTAPYNTERVKITGADTYYTLLEIDADETLYYADQPLTVSGQAYTAQVMDWGRAKSQSVPGEETIRTGTSSVVLNNNPNIHTLLRQNLVVRLYSWYAGQTSADKLRYFKGTIKAFPLGIQTVTIQLEDIGKKFDKLIGLELSPVTYSGADPDDLTKVEPIPIGTVPNVQCLAIEAGAVSTLLNDISAGASSIELSEADGQIPFPNSGTIIIGDEEDIIYSGKTGNILTGVANVSFDYPRSTTVLEKVASLKYLASSIPVKSITVKGILPTGETNVDRVVAIDSGDFSLNLNDSGKGTVTITNIANVKKAVDLAVTTQPNQPITTQPNQPMTTQPVFTTTAVTYIERHATGINLNNNFANPTNAFDFNDTTFANSSSSSGGALKLNYSTTNLGTIQEVRVVVRSSVGSDGSPIITAGNSQTFAMVTGLATRKFVTTISSWSQLATLMVSYDASSPAGQINAYEMYYEIDYIPTLTRSVDSVSNRTTNSVSNRTTDAVVGGNSVADTLGGILLVDLEGAVDDGAGHYTGTPNALIEKPSHVFHYLIETFSNGAVHADIDISGSFADALANLPASYQFDFVITRQINLNELLSWLAHQCWCRFFWEAGLAKLKRILDSGASVRSINTNTDLILDSDNAPWPITVDPSDLSQIWNNVKIQYDLNNVLGYWGNEDAYANITPAATDANSITKYGTRSRTWKMFAIRNQAMAESIRDLITAFYALPKSIITMRSWRKHTDLEPGDLTDITSTQLGLAGNLTDLLETIYVPPDGMKSQGADVWLKMMDLGIFIVLPGPASCVTGVVAPTVVLGSITITPAAASCVTGVVAPTVVLGSITITPSPVSCIAAVVAPTVIVGTYYNSANFFDSTKNFNE